MRYLPQWDSIRRHKVPTWYEDEKVGIFIHWGPYSVPAWAPPSAALGDVPDDETWFCNNPYSEWYLNSVRVGRGPTYEHHAATYGADFPYENFVDQWKAERWDPKDWASLFRRAGARYVVPVTKHHDGFCLWNSAYTDYSTCNRGPGRDIIEELAQAVRAEELRLGLYYSGIIDWRFTKQPMFTGYDVRHPDCIGYDYADYAYNQTIELIDRYRPSVLWNDIGWPYKGEPDLPYLFAHYYNTVEEGVVDDRWNELWHDFTTKEYNAGTKTADKKWECCRGLGLSFAYNQAESEEHIISENGLISLLVDTVAWNGNLLINVGPKADGTIPAIQRERLLAMGRWLEQNGEAIYGTRPWSRQQQELPGGATAFFTQSDESVFALIDRPRGGDSTVVLCGMGGFAGRCAPLGTTSADFAEVDGDLVLNLRNVPAESASLAFRLGK